MTNKLLCFLAAVAVLAACAKEEIPVTETAEEEAEVIEENGYVPGVSIVKLSQELSDLIGDDVEAGNTRTRSAGLNQVLDELGIVSIRRVFDIGGEYEQRQRRAGLDRFYEVEYAKDVPHTRASAELGSVEGVELVEPKPKLRSTSYFNDPYAGDMWGLYNDGSRSGWKAGIDINVEPVWRDYTTGNNKVIVGIVDGGIELSHPDLAANCIAGGEYGSKNFVDTSYTILATDHGTHVAGTVAAVNNNGTGVSSVAGGDYASGIPGVRLMSCQVFKTVDGDDIWGDTADAIRWAADNGAVIINNSWGIIVDLDDDGVISEIELLRAAFLTIGASDKAAVDYFIQYAGCDNDGNQLPDSPMKGGTVIFAAGNDAIPYGAPANYEPVIAVGAIGADGNRTTYSNYGDWVDICAPGGASGGYILSTIPGSRYGLMAGTSMACPHVTGVAALIVSHFGGPGFTNEMLKEKLLKGADTLAVSSSQQIGPLVDAFGSFVYGGTTPPDSVTVLTGKAVGNSVTVSWNATADEDDVRAYSYYILYSKDRSLLAGADPKSPPDGVAFITVLNGNANVGDALSRTFKGLEYGQTYYFGIVASDFVGNCSGISEILEIKTADNNPPVITTSYEGSYTLKAGENTTVPFEIYDPDGHEVTVSFTNGSAADGFVKRSDRTYNLTIDASKAAAGKYTAVITASDGLDETRYEVNYTILANDAPDPVTTLTGSAKNNIVTVNWKATADKEDGTAYSYYILYSKDRSLLAGVDPNSPPAGVTVTTVLNGNASVGDALSHAFELEFGQAYYFAIIASDSQGRLSGMTNILGITVPKNNPPVITTSYTGDYRVRSHQTLEVEFAVSDPDGHDLTTETQTGSRAAEFSRTGNGYLLRITGDGDEPGRYTAVIRCTDAYGASATETIVYELLENHAPRVIKNVENLYFSGINSNLSLDMTEYISDPDGEELTYSVTVGDNKVASLTQNGNILSGTFKNYGLAEVSVTGTDAKGLSCELDFLILVKDPDNLVECYPNPVRTNLNVRTGEAAQTRIRISGASGKTLYDKTSEVSGFYPAVIDMSGYSSGTYVVSVTIGGRTYEKKAAKM